MFTAAHQPLHVCLHTSTRPRRARVATLAALPVEHTAETQSRRALLSASVAGGLALVASPPAALAGLLDYDVRGKGLKKFNLSLGRAEDNGERNSVPA